jgi:hypothetical protein
MAQKELVKDCVVALRCDRMTKESLERLAESLDITVSRLIFKLIESGLRLERERRSTLRGIMHDES